MSEQQNAIGIVHDRECIDALAQVVDKSDRDRIVMEYARRMAEIYREWE